MIVFTFWKAGIGSLLTLKLAKQANKPALHIDLDQHSDAESVIILRKWLKEIRPAILNIAGSRESKAKGVKRGMRLFEVRKVCPDAIILPSDYETYEWERKNIS